MTNMSAKWNKMANDLVHKAKRQKHQAHVRLQNERHALQWCKMHAANLHPGLGVTVYNRTNRSLDWLPLTVVWQQIRPNLEPTVFGQVALTPHMHIATMIYYVLVAAKFKQLSAA